MDNSTEQTQGDGLGLRRSMNLQDVDPEYCVYWNSRISGRVVAEGWLALAEGGYLPLVLDGHQVVVEAVDLPGPTTAPSQHRATDKIQATDIPERGPPKSPGAEGTQREGEAGRLLPNARVF